MPLCSAAENPIPHQRMRAISIHVTIWPMLTKAFFFGVAIHGKFSTGRTGLPGGRCNVPSTERIEFTIKSETKEAFPIVPCLVALNVQREKTLDWEFIHFLKCSWISTFRYSFRRSTGYYGYCTWHNRELMHTGKNAERTCKRERLSSVAINTFADGFQTTATSFYW